MNTSKSCEGLENIKIDDLTVAHRKAVLSACNIPTYPACSHPLKVGDINYLVEKFGKIKKSPEIQRMPVTVRGLTVTKRKV